MFKTALAILKLLEPDILYADLEIVMKTLKDCPNRITNEQELVDTIMKVNLPEWVEEQLKDF